MDELEAAKLEEAAEEADEGEGSKKEQRELAISMMSKKKRRLHDRIAYGKGKKAAHIETLETKRKQIEERGDETASASANAANSQDAEPPRKKKRNKKKKKKQKAK